MLGVHARCLLLALAAVLALGAAKTSLEERAEQIIEDFRSIMATGRPDIKVPVLDPAVIKELPITVKMSPFNANCVASDVRVAGVSGFEFTRLSQIDGTNKLAVSVKLPDVAVNGQYDLKGSVKIGFINVKLNGVGPLVLSLQGLKGDATADVLSNDDGSLNLADLKVDTWSYDKITIKLENLFSGGVVGNTVNKLINKLVPSFVKANRDKITALVETMGKKVINQYLDGVAGKHPAKVLLAAPKATHLTLADSEWIVPDDVQQILDQLALAAALH